MKMIPHCFNNEVGAQGKPVPNCFAFTTVQYVWDHCHTEIWGTEADANFPYFLRIWLSDTVYLLSQSLFALFHLDIFGTFQGLLGSFEVTLVVQKFFFMLVKLCSLWHFIGPTTVIWKLFKKDTRKSDSLGAEWFKPFPLNYNTVTKSWWRKLRQSISHLFLEDVHTYLLQDFPIKLNILHCLPAFNICFLLLCKMLTLFAESFRTDLIFVLVLFSVQISTHLFKSNSTCLRLGSVLWSASVPFLVCKTYGLIGYMRLVVQEHTGKLLLAAVFFFKSFL